jgi:cellulose synthase/poly-beta-1,6-N-acetylglucosamine synthase-like glycosyltransferase
MIDIQQLSLNLLQWLSSSTDLLVLLQIPLPIGLIGLWRWSVWLFRRSIGLCYRPQKPNGFTATTSIITPVYNEDPEVFLAALNSWRQNRPTEIIAVIDQSDQRSISLFFDFMRDCATEGVVNTILIVTEKPGKRPALVDGILAASGEIVCLVDSDTIWAADVLEQVVAPFSDPQVGGVTTRQNVLAPDTLARRLFDVYLDIRYKDEVRFLTALRDTPFGDAVTCLSGRTAVYRRSAVLPMLDGLMNETFLGKRVISGDDKALTLLVQSQGWKVRYQETARVYTPGAPEMRTFLKQRLRWARNSWRADLKALASGWTWRKPLLAYHLLDRLLQPLTTLIGPLYLGYVLYHQQWVAVAVLLTWWFSSRVIKLWPNLQRGISNITILPWYLIFNYWSAVVRIYAFFTMNQQGWITRWDKSRMALLGPLRLVPGYVATILTVAAVAFFLYTM